MPIERGAGHMETIAFETRIEAAHRKLKDLCRRAGMSPGQLALVLEALEELCVVDEELRTQNEELAATREEVEGERRRYHDLFEFAPNPYLVTDPSGMITEANHAAAVMLNVDRFFLIGQPLLAYLTREHHKPYSALLRRLRSEKAGTERCPEVWARPIKSAPIAIDITAAPVRDLRARLTGIRWLLRDITERKKAETALAEYSERLEGMVEERSRDLRQATERLSRQDRLAALGQLSGSMSHELRTPLATIGASAHFLSGKLKDSDENVREHLERIETTVQRAGRIIQVFLDLTQARVPKVERIDVRAIAADAAASCDIPATVKVAFDLPEHEVPVDADHDHLQAAFRNILDNSVEAMHGEGRLTVSVRRAPDGRAEVSFTDTGTGIEPECLSRIFEPLFSTKPKGIGLGLAIAQTLVGKHGGTIEARSAPGAGATMTIRLPSADDGQPVTPRCAST